MFAGLCALMSSREADGRNGNHESVALFPPLLPPCCGFSTATEQVNLHIKGFPLQTGTLNPGRKTRGVAALVAHIKHAFLWTGCLERSGSWDSGELRGTLSFKKTEGKK